MKYVTINAHEAKVELIDVPTIEDAYRAVGIDDDNISKEFGRDHALIAQGIAIVLDGCGLLIQPADQRYFQIGRQLYGGNAVIYGVGDEGETVDMDDKPMVLFFKNAREVERAIAMGQVDRPTTRLNDIKIWEWHA